MTDGVAWDALVEGEELLVRSDELLWRQVSPSHLVDDGRVSSQAFRPSDKDQGRLSTSREDKQTAEGAFRFHTSVLGFTSAGTWAVSIAEVAAAGLRAIDDGSAGTAPPPCPPGHTSVDFRPFNANKRRKIGSLLLSDAVRRGRQHPPAV